MNTERTPEYPMYYLGRPRAQYEERFPQPDRRTVA